MERRDRRDRGFEGLFVPAGLFVGLGIGFILNSIPGFLILGLGIGFLAMAVARAAKHR